MFRFFVIFAVLGIAMAAPAARTARASGTAWSTQYAVANGVAGETVAYLGSTAAPADTIGDVITFTAMPSQGSTAAPTIELRASTLEFPLVGAACDSSPASGSTLLAIQKCFALANIFSATPGDVTWTAKNLRTGTSVGGTITFLPERAVVPMVWMTSDQASYLYVQNASAIASTAVVAFIQSPNMWYITPPEHLGQWSMKIVPEALPNFTGVAIIGSDQPVAATAELDRLATGGRSSVGFHDGALPAAGVTGETITLPYIANQLGGAYNTEFMVANTGATTACAVISYAFVPNAGTVPSSGRPPFVDSGPGGSGCTSGYPIPVAGQIGFSPLGGPDTAPMPPTTTGTLMAVTISVTQGSAAATVGAYTTDGTAKSAGYGGFVVSATGSGAPAPDIGTNIVLPIELKTADGYYTQNLISNPGTTPAHVTLTYTGGGGNYPVTMTIPANGVGNHSVYSDNTVPVGFVGSATLTSDVPVAVVLFRAKMTTAGSFVDEDVYTAVNGVSAAKASTSLYLPLIARHVLADASHDGLNTWVSITVPGGGTANVSSLATGGCPGPFTQSEVHKVQGSFILYQNANTDNGLEGAIPCFVGAMWIRSDTPIIAVAAAISDLDPGDQEDMYNAFPGQ